MSMESLFIYLLDFVYILIYKKILMTGFVAQFHI